MPLHVLFVVHNTTAQRFLVRLPLKDLLLQRACAQQTINLQFKQK
jgi:hypothetical protein